MGNDQEPSTYKKKKGLWLKFKSLFQTNSNRKRRNELRQFYVKSSEDATSQCSSKPTVTTDATYIENDGDVGHNQYFSDGCASNKNFDTINQVGESKQIPDNTLRSELQNEIDNASKQQNHNAPQEYEDNNEISDSSLKSENQSNFSNSKGITYETNCNNPTPPNRPRTPRSALPGRVGGRHSGPRTAGGRLGGGAQSMGFPRRAQGAMGLGGRPGGAIGRSGRPTRSMGLGGRLGGAMGLSGMGRRAMGMGRAVARIPGLNFQGSGAAAMMEAGAQQPAPRLSGGGVAPPRESRPRFGGIDVKELLKESRSGELTGEKPPEVALANKFCKKRLRRRNERIKRRVRRRLDFALQAMDSQSRIGFLIQNASKRTPLTYPMFPYFPTEWAKGCLPLQSRDPSVLIKLYTWLLGLEEVFVRMDKKDETYLRRKVSYRLSAEDEVAAVKMISSQLKSKNQKDYKAAWNVLSDDNYFKEYVAQRTYLERKEGILLSIRSLKTTVKWQLENVCKGMFP